MVWLRREAPITAIERGRKMASSEVEEASRPGCFADFFAGCFEGFLLGMLASLTV